MIGILVQILHFSVYVTSVSLVQIQHHTQKLLTNSAHCTHMTYLEWKERNFSELFPLYLRQYMCRSHCPEAESELSEACFHQIKYELQENQNFLKICKQVVIPKQATKSKHILRKFFIKISEQNKKIPIT